MRIVQSFVPMLLLCTACDKGGGEPLPVDTASLREIALLPAVLKESSGLEVSHSGLFWSHNDHGGAAALYGFDSSGSLLRTLLISNATNEDWEDLAQDSTGNFYIGDFGNNANDRQNQVIYKIPNPDETTGNEVAAEKIFFNLEDQTAFPPPESAWLFDVEAMLAKGEFLYLFTRDRSKPFQGKMKLYKLPNTPGTHVAVLLGEFSTDARQNAGAITSADISPGGSRVAILSNRAVWEFTEFQGDDFFGGKARRIGLPLDAQMEGITYLDNCDAYLTNETKNGYASRLFRLKMCG
jgi:hypothetical protein